MSSEPQLDPNGDPVSALAETIERARGSVLYADRLRDVQIRSVGDLRNVPITTRGDLQRAGPHGTRALPLEQVCHYGETSGTTGASNSTWLTAGDLRKNAERIASRHPDVFGAGRIVLNRFPFMAAPAHLVQLVAQAGGGVSIPAGNINWDVPFPRALELAQTTGAQVLAGLPIEPVVLAQIALAKGLDPAKATRFDTFFLGGAPLPPALRQRIERVWSTRVVDLYGSTETMLLGTSCPEGTLHLEPDLVYVEMLQPDSDDDVGVGEPGRLVVTTLGVEGSPLVRFDTGDLVRRLPPCGCGDPRAGIVVLGRAADVVELSGSRLHPYEIIDAAADAADAADSSVFFVVILPDRLLVRIEAAGDAAGPLDRLRERLGVPVEVEMARPNDVLDVELLARSPSVYKPVVTSDWRGGGRRVLSVSEGMIEWPGLSLGAAGRWLGRSVRRSLRRRRLGRGI